MQPVLRFTFDQVGGGVVTNIGTGGAAMNGTLTGGATIVAGGRYGKALNIPSGAATSAYVLVNNSGVPLNGAPGSSWTVAMWLKNFHRRRRLSLSRRRRVGLRQHGILFRKRHAR